MFKIHNNILYVIYKVKFTGKKKTFLSYFIAIGSSTAVYSFIYFNYQHLAFLFNANQIEIDSDNILKASDDNVDHISSRSKWDKRGPKKKTFLIYECAVRMLKRVVQVIIFYNVIKNGVEAVNKNDAHGVYFFGY